MKKLLAFTNVTVTKSEFMEELRAHEKADAFIKGTYEEHGVKNAVGDFQGCAIGCSLHSVTRIKGLKIDVSLHLNYEKHLGIPEWLAKVQDLLYEGMSTERRKKWPVQFGDAIREGAELDKVKGPFLCVIMRRSLTRFDHAKFPAVKAAIDQTIACWENPNSTPEDFEKARAEAARAAWAAEAAKAAWAAEAAARAAEAEYEYFADELIKLLKNC